MTPNPVIVEEYLAGDNGIFIMVGTVLAAVWLTRKIRGELGDLSPHMPTKKAVSEVRACRSG